METKIYLYDAVGTDKELNIDEINQTKIGKKQLLWVKSSRREHKTLKKIFQTLELEDIDLNEILNKKKRPKITLFENYFSFNIYSIELKTIKKLPIDIVAGNNFVVTIQDGEVEYFDEFRQQIKGETRIGELDSESFIATILDLHIVSYFRALEIIEEKVDELDEVVLKEDLQTEDFLTKMAELRQQVSNLRRWFLPHRDVFYMFLRPDFKQISESDSLGHFELLCQHFENAFDAIESSRDTVLSLFEFYAAKSSQITNDLVQRLTFITIITGLLGVIAGILGMNFKLDFFESEGGFWITLTGMFLLSGLLIIVAKRKRWI